MDGADQHSVQSVCRSPDGCKYIEFYANAGIELSII